VKIPVETEVKLRMESKAKARLLLRSHGFNISTPRVLERNFILDDSQGSLRARGVTLRLRGAGKKATCTFKGIEVSGRHKRREESEFQVSDLESCRAVFVALGLREVFLYEKYRTEFAREAEPGHATLDETPIGVFIELEGPGRWIDRTAQALGFPQAAYITASYGRLYIDWCAARGIQPSNMTFTRRR
jgi:adenylate cyclase, class 2